MESLKSFGIIAQFLGSCTLLYSFLPQIYKLFKNKNSDGMNLQYWSILTIGLTCIAINLAINKVNYFIQGTQWLNIVLALIVLVLSVKYRKQPQN